MLFKKIAILKKSFILLFATFSLLISAGSQATTRANEAWSLIEEGAFLVDVRTPQEYNAGHIRGAINYPLRTINIAFNNIKKDQQIVVYCRSGNRSGQAQRYLTQIGFINVHNAGGLNELIAAKQ